MGEDTQTHLDLARTFEAPFFRVQAKQVGILLASGFRIRRTSWDDGQFLLFTGTNILLVDGHASPNRGVVEPKAEHVQPLLETIGAILKDGRGGWWASPSPFSEDARP